MDSVNKTLYIPLYGKALVSRLGILLHDPKAEEIWAAEGFALTGKAASKWLAYYMAMRASVMDRWTAEASRPWRSARLMPAPRTSSSNGSRPASRAKHKNAALPATEKLRVVRLIFIICTFHKVKINMVY